MQLRQFMNQRGEKFTIIRDDEIVSTVNGMKNTSHGRKMIQFYPDTDIKPGDWVESILSNEKFYVDDVTTSRGLDRNKIFSKDAFYLTEVEHRKSNEKSIPSVMFNIGDVQNSIIGTQHSATLTNNFSDKQIKDYIEQNCGEDKELMNDMLKMVNSIIENNIPVQKGTFARFSDKASKYGWLLGAMTSKLLTHFF